MKKLITLLSGILLMSISVYAEEPSPWAKESIDRAIEAGIVPDTLQLDYTEIYNPQGVLLSCGTDLYS